METLLTDEVLTATGQNQYGSIASLSGGGFIATWETYDPEWAYNGRIYDNQGSAVSGDILISDPQPDQHWPAVGGLENGNFVVVSNFNNSQPGVGQIFGPDGTPITGHLSAQW